MKVETVIEQLTFSTVRIEAFSNNGTSVGTASFFSYQDSGDARYHFLVTNRHVVENAKRFAFFFIKGQDKHPVLGEQMDILVDQPQYTWHYHSDPEVDIAVMPLAPVLDGLKNKEIEIFLKSIPHTVIPTQEQLAEMDALEEILFVGYPIGLYDSANLTPIWRSGITATPPQLDYENRPAFLIDASVFPGSSGSPVFLYRHGGYRNRQGGLEIGRTQIFFMGVVTQVFYDTQFGRIEQHPVPTRTEPRARMQEKIDLGVVTKSTAVLETVKQTIAAYGR